jgi:hypothetical protein
MTHDVLDRLNALIRRRSYVAQSGDPTAGAAVGGSGTGKRGTPPAPSADDDDVPVLTEEVGAAVSTAELPSPRAARSEDPESGSLTAELVDLVEQRLASELPALLDTAIARLAAELRGGIGKITEAAVRDFLARQQPTEPPPVSLDAPEP